MEMLLTRSSKKILLTAGLVLIVFYLMYRGKLSPVKDPSAPYTSIGTSSETVVDCPKTESMSKKTSMISSVIYTCSVWPNLTLTHRMGPFLSMTASPHLYSLEVFQDQVHTSGGFFFLCSKRFPRLPQV